MSFSRCQVAKYGDTSNGLNSTMGPFIDPVREGGFRKESGLDKEVAREPVSEGTACLRYLGLFKRQKFRNYKQYTRVKGMSTSKIEN